MTEVEEVLKKFTRVAVVGISPKKERASHHVATYLRDHGYDVVGVRPNSDDIDGIPVVGTLAEISGQVEVVDVFRASNFVSGIVDEAIAVGAKALWLQEGVGDSDAEKRAEDAGMVVISNLCMLKEHEKLSR